MAADPVDPDVLAGAGPQRAADPAAARARRPGRHAEVRLRRRPPDARAGQRPRDRRPGRARRGRAGASSARRSASRSSRHVVELGDGRARRRRRCRRPDDLRDARRRPGALPRPGRAARRWSPRSTPRRRTATPSAASSRCSPTACRRAWVSHVHWDRQLDARLAAALMGIQAIKGVEVGDGFDAGRARRGSQAHDEIVADRRRASAGVTGRAGGIEGGMTTGELAAGPGRDEADLHRAAGAATLDVATGEAGRRASTSAPTSARCRPPGWSPRRWSRWCSPTRSPEKFGGDSVAETAPQRRTATWTTLVDADRDRAERA